MFAQMGTIPEFALAVIGNVLTLCTFVYLISMNEARARYLLRTFFKLQLPTLMLMVAVFSALLAANFNTRFDGAARNFGWPAVAVSISNGAFSVNGWPLLVNLSTGFGLLVPLLAGVEGFLRRQRGLTFEPAPRLVGASQFSGTASGTETLRAPSRRRQTALKVEPIEDLPPTPRFRLPAFTFTAVCALLLILALLQLKRAWIPWVVDRAYIQPEHAIDPGAVTALAFFPDQSRFICGYRDGQLVEWTLHDGSYSIARFIGHTTPITNITISASGETFTSMSSNSEMRFWRTDICGELLRLAQQDKLRVVAAQGLDDKRVVAAFSDGNVRLYDPDGRVERTFIGGMGKLTWTGFVNGGDAVVSANFRGVMQYWNCDSWATPAESHPVDLKYENDDCVRLWDNDAIVLKGDTADLVQGYVVDGCCWVLTYAHRGQVDLWSPASGRRLRSVPDLLPATESASCTPDGKTILTTDDQHRRQEWHYEPNATLAAHSSELRSVRQAPDKSHFLTASRDGTARVWDAATGRERAVFSGNKSGLLLATFSGAGERVITAAEDGSVRVFDAKTQAELAALPGPTAENASENRSADISADGARILFLRADGSVRVCATDPPRELGVLPLAAAKTPDASAEEVTVARFEPAGHRVLTGNRDARLKIWKHVLQWPSGLWTLWQTAAVGLTALAMISCFGVEFVLWRRRSVPLVA
jgi:WD40 repeat protein